MADTPKKVVRLIDNIKLELYEGNRKKYVQIWDPTGNNTYNEDDKGPSGIKSPERSKKYYENHKEKLLQKMKDNPISSDKRKEYNKNYYLKRKEIQNIKE